MSNQWKLTRAAQPATDQHSLESTYMERNCSLCQQEKPMQGHTAARSAPPDSRCTATNASSSRTSLELSFGLSHPSPVCIKGSRPALSTQSSGSGSGSGSAGGLLALLSSVRNVAYEAAAHLRTFGSPRSNSRLATPQATDVGAAARSTRDGHHTKTAHMPSPGSSALPSLALRAAAGSAPVALEGSSRDSAFMGCSSYDKARRPHSGSSGHSACWDASRQQAQLHGLLVEDSVANMAPWSESDFMIDDVAPCPSSNRSSLDEPGPIYDGDSSSLGHQRQGKHAATALQHWSSSIHSSGHLPTSEATLAAGPTSSGVTTASGAAPATFTESLHINTQTALQAPAPSTGPQALGQNSSTHIHGTCNAADSSGGTMCCTTATGDSFSLTSMCTGIQPGFFAATQSACSRMADDLSINLMGNAAPDVAMMWPLCLMAGDNPSQTCQIAVHVQTPLVQQAQPNLRSCQGWCGPPQHRVASLPSLPSCSWALPNIPGSGSSAGRQAFTGTTGMRACSTAALASAGGGSCMVAGCFGECNALASPNCPVTPHAHDVSVSFLLSGAELTTVQVCGPHSEAVGTLPCLPGLQIVNVFASSSSSCHDNGTVGPSANLLAMSAPVTLELHDMFARHVKAYLQATLPGTPTTVGSTLSAACCLSAEAQRDIACLRQPSTTTAPWRLSAPVWAAAKDVWSEVFAPLVNDITYLLLCVPGCFAHGLVAWDRSMYCETLARLLALLERNKLWQTISALLQYCTGQGVSLMYQGAPLKCEGGGLSAERLQQLLENALHSEIGVTAHALAAPVPAPPPPPHPASLPSVSPRLPQPQHSGSPPSSSSLDLLAINASSTSVATPTCALPPATGSSYAHAAITFSPHDAASRLSRREADEDDADTLNLVQTLYGADHHRQQQRWQQQQQADSQQAMHARVDSVLSLSTWTQTHMLPQPPAAIAVRARRASLPPDMVAAFTQDSSPAAIAASSARYGAMGSDAGLESLESFLSSLPPTPDAATAAAAAAVTAWRRRSVDVSSLSNNLTAGTSRFGHEAHVQREGSSKGWPIGRTTSNMSSQMAAAALPLSAAVDARGGAATTPGTTPDCTTPGGSRPLQSQRSLSRAVGNALSKLGLTYSRGTAAQRSTATSTCNTPMAGTSASGRGLSSCADAVSVWDMHQGDGDTAAAFGVPEQQGAASSTTPDSAMHQAEATSGSGNDSRLGHLIESGGVVLLAFVAMALQSLL